VAKQTQRTGARNVPQQQNDPQPPATFNRTERTLAFMVGGVFGVSLLCVIIMIVAWLTIHDIPGTGVWPAITVLPEVGFPIGMLLVFALLGVTWTRRARENRNGTR
jgi:hypothetical protein